MERREILAGIIFHTGLEQSGKAVLQDEGNLLVLSIGAGRSRHYAFGLDLPTYPNVF